MARVTITDLINTARARKMGANAGVSVSAPAPEVIYVTTDKPKLPPLSIAEAYEEYIQHQVIAQNMSIKTVRHWRYMAKLTTTYFSGEANEHTRAHNPVPSIQALTYDDTLNFWWDF